MVTEEVKPKKKIAKRQSRFKLALSGFNRKYIDEAVKFYLDRGIDPMIISGIFGNISKESDWNPLANSKDNGLGDFYGLVLMSPDMRKEVKRVYGKVDANTTHQFIYDSMTGNKKISPAWRSYMKDYGGYWNNKYNDPETAAMAFGTVFERPSEKYADWGERMRSARDAYDHIISITNALKNAKAKSFGNPVKTTVTADGNKVMTINPEYWELQGMLQPVLTELPVQQPTPTAPVKKIAPRIEDVAIAPWDLNQLILNRGVDVTSQKSPFSLDLSLPSLGDMLLINSPRRQMEQYFADILGISDMAPLTPSLFPKLKDGKVPNDPYERFKYSLPDNQKNTPESEYNTRRYWELNGRPKSFQEAVEREMYDLLEDGWHANSVSYNLDTGEYEFMKPRNHPTVHKELEWYNSDDAKEFRKKYKHIQPKNSNFDKYVPRLKNGKLPGFGDGTPTKVGEYNVYPSAVGASELNVTVPDVVVTGTDRRPMYQRYDAENSTYDPNAVRNFTDFAPIVGDIGLGLDLYRALENLNYPQAAALGGLLLLPNAIEKSGKTILKAGLKYAPNITKNIYDISKLYTNVEDNPRLRRYANDVVDLLKSKQISERVAESIDNVDISKQVSNISNTPITFYHSNSGKVWIRPIITLKPLGINREFRSIIPKYGNYAGNYDPIGKKVFIKRSGRNPEQIKQTTYHETSHASDNAFPESVGIKFYDRKTNVEGVIPYFDQSTEKRARLLSILTDAFKHGIDINNKSAIEEFITSPNYTNHNLNSLLNNYKYLDVESDFYDLLDNGYKNGKLPGEKISIKPANRGKFTRLKKRTGHSASWFKAHGTPALKKMATFALNARKWKH